ncbi:hypothetical protein O6P43_025440 [Quillaja saponaria]|uniref:Uncharacterized protein n=1 Tax=Quillaja saponaria TaxID=32244 RepID=A0AAD7LAL0_QUISA|nr:hypothetical protein O6P43_025440 [Quillaja saponaria]
MRNWKKSRSDNGVSHSQRSVLKARDLILPSQHVSLTVLTGYRFNNGDQPGEPFELLNYKLKYDLREIRP